MDIAQLLGGLHSMPYLRMHSMLDLEMLHRAAILQYDQSSSFRKKVASALFCSEMLVCLAITPPSLRPLKPNYVTTCNVL